MFKNLSSRVSAKTIEETYTDNDVQHATTVIDGAEVETNDISPSYNPSTGFTFDYPMRWLNDKSDYKAIGIRRLKVIPTSHVFSLYVSIWYQSKEDADAEEEARADLAAAIAAGDSEAIEEAQDNLDEAVEGDTIGPYHIPLTILSENSFEEVIHTIINDLNERIARNALSDHFAFTYNYDYRTGRFKLYMTTNPNKAAKYTFRISGGTDSLGGDDPDDPDQQDIENRVRNLEEFLRFLNQKPTQSNLDQLTTSSTMKEFSNVWDRTSLQFHTSFSDNRRGFIGLNNDFYENPSVFYDPPTNSSDFWIRFTTDGVHNILPRYCRFYIGLCFVRNYKTSLVTK